jgi:quercetin dioxygenase-like cupin family protein
MNPRRRKAPFIAQAAPDNQLWFSGHLMTILADNEATGGSYSLMEVRMRAGYEPGPHVHSRDDETVYVLEGTLDVTCGDERYVAEGGALVYLPRGIWHHYMVRGSDARFLCLLQPGGIEEGFRALALPAAAPTLPPEPIAPLDPIKVLAVFGALGVQLQTRSDDSEAAGSAKSL